MAEFNFDELRAEAMEGVEREPYVLKMPGRMKDVVIEDVPVKLFMASFDTDSLVPAAASRGLSSRLLSPPRTSSGCVTSSPTSRLRLSPSSRRLSLTISI